MKMQVRFAIVLFVVVGFLPGCGSAPEDELKPEGANTKAAKLVGKWKFVKRTPWTFLDTLEKEYTRDGKVVNVYYNQYDGQRISVGIYEVDGDTIFHDFNNEVGRRAATLEILTADKLVISGVNEDGKYTVEFERIRK